MDLYSNTGRSMPQRLVIFVLETGLAAATAWLLLGPGLGWLHAHLGFIGGPGDLGRRWLLVACTLVVWARGGFMIFYLLRRGITWGEAANVPFAYAVYYLGFGLLGGPNPRALGVVAWVGAGLFAAGSALGTGAELARHLWKRHPEHQGRIYTGGPFRYAVHVNFFGEILWVLGMALVCENAWALLIPALTFSLFAFFNVPALDRHLADHYGEAFTEWASRTKKLIPFVY